MEYAHSTLTTSATLLSLFEASLGYKPLLFPQQEADLTVPSIQHHLQHYNWGWTRTREALLHTAARQHRYANGQRTPAPKYSPGQKVWLALYSGQSTQPHSPTAIKLHLLPALRIHTVFHVSHVKAVLSGPLYLPLDPPPPVRLINRHLAFMVRSIQDVWCWGRGQQFFVD